MKKIKVLHIITRLITGGADENTLYTVNGLPEDQYDVMLATGPDAEPEMLRRIKWNRYVIVPSLQRELHPMKDLKALCQLVKIMHAGHYDIVHTHVAKAGILGRLAATIARVPIVVHTLHGITFHKHLPPFVRKFYLIAERIMEKCTHLFINVGNDLKHTYIKHGVGRQNKHQVIRSGFDLNKFSLAGEHRDRYKNELIHKLNIPANSTLIGTAARIEPRKGIQYFIEAANNINGEFPEVHYVVAGQGEYQSEMERYSRRLGLENRFHFIGYVNDIETYLSGLDIFVMSSLWEGLPRALVQAGAVGLPVVSFEVEGVREIVKNESNGFIVKSKDVKTLQHKIVSLLKHPQTIRDMGKEGRCRICNDWHYSEMVNRIDHEYKKLLSKHSFNNAGTIK